MKKIMMLCAAFVSWTLQSSSPFSLLELSPFATPAELEKQYAQIVEKQVAETNSAQERKDIRKRLGDAYKKIQKANDRRILMYNMLVNGSSKKAPNFPGLTATESKQLADQLLQMRQLIGTRLSASDSNVIDSNETIEKDYEYRKKTFDQQNVSQAKKDELERAHVVLTAPWRWKEFLPTEIIDRMDMKLEQAEEYAQQRAQEDAKKKQNELNEQRERERIAKEKAEAERKVKEATDAQEKLRREKAEQEKRKKEEEQAAREAARRKQEEEDRIQIQKEREEKERQKALQQQSNVEQPKTLPVPVEWKAPILVLGKSFQVPEAIAKKVTFELKNKLREFGLEIQLLLDGDKGKSVTAAYRNEAAAQKSSGKNEEDHGYLRMTGLDPKAAYKLILTLKGASGKLATYAYNLKANKDRKAIILTFEKEGNNLILRPQKGAFLSSKSQSGLSLDGNIKSSDIKDLGLYSSTFNE